MRARDPQCRVRLISSLRQLAHTVSLAGASALAVMIFGQFTAEAAPRQPTLSDSGWEFWAWPTSCDLKHRFSGKPNGSVSLGINDRRDDRIVVGVIEYELSGHASGLIRFSFSDADPIVMETNVYSSGVFLVFFDKRLHDSFLARMSRSTSMTIDYPNWPEEYPINMPTPSAILRQKWLDCAGSVQPKHP